MKFLVIIPTFNEALSVGKVIESILELPENIEILIVDDSSPDGTADLVRAMNSPLLHLLIRPEKSGLGGAYRAGMSWALSQGEYDFIVTMDGDGSHRTVDLARMLAQLNPEIDLLMGVRWMPGGAIENWPKYRQFLSQAGTSYAKWALKLPYRDLTGGFRIYSQEILSQLRLPAVASDGYCFQIEMVRAVSAAEGRIFEAPITFVEREFGVSKMSKKIVREALIRVSIWGLQRRFETNADKLHYVK